MKHEVLDGELVKDHIIRISPHRVEVLALAVGVYVPKGLPLTQDAHPDFFKRLLVKLRTVLLLEGGSHIYMLSKEGLDALMEVGPSILDLP